MVFLFNEPCVIVVLEEKNKMIERAQISSDAMQGSEIVNDPSKFHYIHHLLGVCHKLFSLT